MERPDPIIILKELVSLSRPEWSLIFSGCVLLLGILYPAQDIILGLVSLFLFASGHFSLSALADVESDKINPRRSIRNPYVNSEYLNKHIILSWVGLLWGLVILINILYLPDLFTIRKLPIAITCMAAAFSSSYLYSMPPFRLKGKPVLDLVLLIIVVGFFMPLYAAILHPSYPPLDRFIAGIILSTNLIFGIYFVAILADLDYDRQTGDITTAVWLGWDYGSIFAAFLIIVRATSVLLLYLYWLSTKTVIPPPVGIIFLLVEYALAINLLYKRNRGTANFTWKMMVIISILHTIVFIVLVNL